MDGALSSDSLPRLEAWHDFYLVVGPAAAALTGLLFVIVSLGPQVMAGNERNVRAFLSPTATYFTSVLVISGVMLTPGLSFRVLGSAITVASICALAYVAWAGPHRRWRESSLPWSDWIWNVALPIVAFLIALAAGVALINRESLGLHGVALMLMLLIVIGIRNAWDVVLWVARQPRSESERPKHSKARRAKYE